MQKETRFIHFPAMTWWPFISCCMLGCICSAAEPQLVTLDGHNGPVGGISFSPDSTVLAAASTDARSQKGEVRFWDLKTATPIRVLQPESGIGAVAYSFDGKLVAAGGKAITIWDAASGEKQVAINESDGNFGCLAFSPRNNQLAAAGFNLSPSGKVAGRAVIWQIPEKQQLQVLRGHIANGFVFAAQYSPDGKLLAVGGWYVVGTKQFAALDIWDVEAGTIKATLRGAEGIEAGVELNSIMDKDGRMVNGPGVLSVAFSPDGKTIAAGQVDGSVCIWDLATSRELRTWQAHIKGGMVQAVGFSPDGKTFASASREGILKLWDATKTSDEPLTTLGFGQQFFCLQFSPDGRYLAAGAVDKKVRLWRLTELPATVP